MQETLAHPLFVLLGVYLVDVSHGVHTLAPKLVGECLHVLAVDHGHLHRDLGRVEVNQAAWVRDSSVLGQLVLYKYQARLRIRQLVFNLVE